MRTEALASGGRANGMGGWWREGYGGRATLSPYIFAIAKTWGAVTSLGVSGAGEGEEVGLLPHPLCRLLVRIRGNKQRDPQPPLPPYFRNCENVRGTPQEDEPTQHQARRRPPHSNGHVTIHAPPPTTFDGDREVVVLDCKT